MTERGDGILEWGWDISVVLKGPLVDEEAKEGVGFLDQITNIIDFDESFSRF